MPKKPIGATSRLALYYTANEALRIAVLAPAGWHCISLYGSAGTSILVTPVRYSSTQLMADTFHLDGPAVELAVTDGGTSGRFHVDDLDPWLFPFARPRRERSTGETRPRRGARPSAYRADRMLSRGKDLVRFVTPAMRNGIGTSLSLSKGGLPIEGLVIRRHGAERQPDADVALVNLNARVPLSMKRDVRDIESYVAVAYRR